MGSVKNDEDYIIEKIEERPEGSWEYRSVRMGQGKVPLKVKLLIAAFMIGGAAVGVFLFLFFLTLFLYVFIPAMILLALWNFFRGRK